MANYRAIATEIGDLLKYSTSVNEINRIGSAVLKVRRDSFPNDSITSARAQFIYDWILSLEGESMNPEDRDRQLVDFCRKLTPNDMHESACRILVENGISPAMVQGEKSLHFNARNFHPAVVEHCQKLFLQENYFHAVFEACKVYNKAVKTKAQGEKDGHSLMLDVWGWEKGVLKLNPCVTETDKNVQDGIKFLSAGMMQAVRNPTAHEPALHWPIDERDCLDLLSFLSFLFRKLDAAVYYKP